MAEHLMHGWERDTDVSDSLLRQFVLASAGRAAGLAELTGGRALRTDEFVAGDPTSTVMFDNAAVLLQPPEYVDIDAVATAIDSFFPPQRHFVVLSAFPTPSFEHHGWSLMGHPPLMLRPAGGDPPPLPDGLTIREVTDVARLETFITTIIDAYPIPGATGSPIADGRVLAGPIRFFVGELDGVPVGTAKSRLNQALGQLRKAIE